MFSLESSISAWRKQMLAAGLSQDLLAELESHLRERVIHLQLGLSEADAFQTATMQLGTLKTLRKEFSKIGTRRAGFHWDNPWPLHFLSLFYAYWGLYTVWFIIAHHFYAPGFRSGQLYVWSLVLNVGIAVGLLRRQNSWRLYALVSTGIGCLFPLRDLAAAYFAPAGNFPVWHWTPPHIFFLFNFALNLWALYILTRPSIRELFRTASLVQHATRNP